jgi:putative transposase
LLSRYKEINIGNVSIKSMISNLTGNIYKVVKRRLVALSHYKFRMKLHSMSNKFGCIVNEISEFQTSIKCHNCYNLKRDLGSNKVYNCLKCGLILDRDINAAINITKL